MLLIRGCRLRKNVSLGITLSLLLLSVGPIQMASAQTSDDETTESIEEIIVYGAKSLLRYRHEMEVAEDTMYDLYNMLNDDDEYDVVCDDVASTYSRIKRRKCRGRFELEGLSDEEQRRLQDGLLPGNNSAEILRKKGIVLDKMESIANENHEFREALFELTRISRDFEAAKEER